MTRQEAPLEAAVDLKLPDLYAWQELALAGVMLMELSWLTIWAEVLFRIGGQIDRVVLLLILALVMGSAHAGVRALNFLKLNLRFRRLAAAGFLIAAVIGTLKSTIYLNEALAPLELLLRPMRALMDLSTLFPPELAVILTVLYAAYRGLNLAQNPVGPLKVVGHLRFGFLMFLLYSIFVTLLTGESPIFLWGLFLSAALFATGTSRVAVFRILRGGAHLKFDRTWFFGITLTVLGSIGVASLLGILLTGLAPILIGVLARLILGLMFLIIMPFVFVLVYLLTQMVSVINLEDMALFEGLNVGLARLRGMAQMLSEFASDYSWVLVRLNELWLTWGPVLKVTLCSGVILLIGGMIAYRLRERAARAALYPDEEIEDLLQGEDLFASLRSGLLEGMQQLADRLNLSGRFGHRRQALAAARIRQIYTLMLAQTASLEFPRMAAQTPLEYMQTLKRCYPSLEPEVGVVTHAYMRVRYGELPEERAEIEAVEAAWARIEAFGKRVLASRKKKGPGS